MIVWETLKFDDFLTVKGREFRKKTKKLMEEIEPEVRIQI